jgi:hypothetical protein
LIFDKANFISKNGSYFGQRPKNVWSAVQLPGAIAPGILDLSASVNEFALLPNEKCPLAGALVLFCGEGGIGFADLLGEGVR